MTKISKRVREFCELASLVNADTNQFYPIEYYECNNPSQGPKLTKKFSDWNLNSVDEWECVLEKEINWIYANKQKVMQVLPIIQSDWPESCNMIRQLFNTK